MKNEEYIHPNLIPSDKDKYLNLVNRLRAEAKGLTSEDFIFISKEDYEILEDSANESMKVRGHQVYGVQIKVKDYELL